MRASVPGVHKSSIYLPDELKASLTARAQRTGTSEAELIRRAIERLLAAEDASEESPRRRTPVHRGPALVGVGVGPGDPDLVTDRARATLEESDRVLVVSSDAHAIGRAESLVRVVAPMATVVRVPFAIAGDEQERARSLDRLADEADTALGAGGLVALAVLGDPGQWTIFPDLARRMTDRRRGLPVHFEPGITSYQASAAEGGVPLGLPGGPLVVTSDSDTVEQFLGSDATVVLYKATNDVARLRKLARKSGRRCVVAEATGPWPATVRDLDEVADGPLPYLATVVFPSPAERAGTTTGGGR
jgi:precorrin-2/cobalt-factor-2 C20-methyltransferase